MRLPTRHHLLVPCLSLVFLACSVTDAQDAAKGPAPAPTADEGALSEVSRSLAAEDWGAAATNARLLARPTSPAEIRLAALEHLATALAGLGEPKESAEGAQQAEALFREQEKKRLAKSKVYNRNRSALDGTRTYDIALLRKRQVAANAAGRAEDATAIAVTLAESFPAHHKRRTFALEAAEQLVALGREEQALPWFVAALDTGLDRCFVAKAKLRDNQVQLDAVAKALPLDLVKRALAGLTGEPNETGLAAADAFHAALVLTREPDGGKAAKALTALLREPFPEQGPLAGIVRLELARVHLRSGHATEARAVLASIPGARLREPGLPATRGETAIAGHREFLLGMAANLALDRSEAAVHFRKAATLGGDALSGQARYEQARALELAGQWRTARKGYRTLAKNSPAESIRRCARISLPRLEALGKTPLPKDGGAVTQLPDDRETRGDWYLGYGGECFQLASLFHGGAGNTLKLAFSTSDPKERGRRWTSVRNSPDPAAPWAPHRRSRVAANHDDFGGQYAIGTGPDLLVDVVMPKGNHVLSLYFANDHNYYEANRRYTIEVRADTQLLALAEVRDFGGGVYKRFLVAGPLKLRFCLRRDASLNTLLQGVFLDPIPSLNPSPLQAARSDQPNQDTYSKYARRLTRRPANLARPDPLLPLARSLAAKRKSSPADRRFQSYRLLLAAGRPRSAQRAFEAFAAAVRKEHALAAARKLGKQLGTPASRSSCRPHDWPDGTHPVDRLNKRWFEKYFPSVTPPDTPRIKALLGLLRQTRPQATRYARKQALRQLELHAPKRLSPSVLQAAAKLADQDGDTSQTAAMFRLVLAAKPPPKTELRVSADLLDIAPQAKLPLPEIRTLYARILELAKEEKAKHYFPSVHINAAEAFAAHGEYDEAIALLDHVPPQLADRLHKSYQRRLDAKLKKK